VKRCIWALVATLVSWSPVVFATSANATLTVSVVVQRSCTVTHTEADPDVLVKCAPGGAPAVVHNDPDVAARAGDSLSTSVAPAESTSDTRLHYVTIQF
jgi:hypothetical protein